MPKGDINSLCCLLLPYAMMTKICVNIGSDNGLLPDSKKPLPVPVLSMWGKIIIPMYRLWLNGLYGLYGPRCPLSSKRPINLISLSLSLCQCWLIISKVQWHLAGSNFTGDTSATNHKNYHLNFPGRSELILSFFVKIDGLVQDCSNSFANALELLQSCTKPSNDVSFKSVLWCLYSWVPS